MKRVVVTGLGVVSAAGQSIEDFGNALWTGHSGIRQLPDFGEHSLGCGALLTSAELDEALKKLICLPDKLQQKARSFKRRAPLSIQASIVAAIEAWQHAQLVTSNVDVSRVSLVVAGQNLNRQEAFALQQQYEESLDFLPPRYGVQFLDTDQVGTISELLGIRGEGMMVGGASASGNLGLIQGCRMIEWGVADVCVVLGGLMHLSPLELQAFRATGALGGTGITDASKVCRPFDQDHEGFVYGQGSGCLILESEESARRRGVPILSEVAGYSMNLDGNRLTNPSVKGEAQAMNDALSKASVRPEELTYINTHGTSSVLGDDVELAAIDSLFGMSNSTTWLNATKSYTGHCLTAAGVIEAIATILQMNKNFLHANLNLDNPIETTCSLVGNQRQAITIDNAMSNSFGFGGINSAIVFKKTGSE